MNITINEMLEAAHTLLARDTLKKYHTVSTLKYKCL